MQAMPDIVARPGEPGEVSKLICYNRLHLVLDAEVICLAGMVSLQCAEECPGSTSKECRKVLLAIQKLVNIPGAAYAAQLVLVCLPTAQVFI